MSLFKYQQSDKLATSVYDNAAQNTPPVLAAVASYVSDIYQVGVSHLSSPDKPGNIVSGKIVSSIPFLNWYRVQLDDGGGDIGCCRLSSDTGLTPMGAKDSGLFPPDSLVLIYKPVDSFYGIILGAIPAISQDGSLCFSEWVSQGGNAGFHKESHYSQLFSLLQSGGGLFDFSAGRPIDSTIFDWGKITELGGRIHVDPFMVQVAMDEMCGLSLFYHDQFTRLAGHNFDLLTSSTLLAVRDDEGETYKFEGEALYPWEALGAYKYATEIHKKQTATQVQYDEPYGTYEPKDNNQQPFYRFREWGGYLGQGKMREMVLPPSTGTTHKLGEDTLIGVFREHIAPDGGFSLQSAKSVTIAKRAPIPIPKRLKLPEDYSSDADSKENDNYKFSGIFGGGDSHKIGDMKNKRDLSHLKSVVGIQDKHAHDLNWKTLNGFYQHTHDFKIEESDLDVVQRPPGFSALRTDTWMDAPYPVPLHVDHRYNAANFYEVLSHITLSEDGGVVIGDGYGSEIKLVGGNIVLSCPGDVMLNPGRSIVAMAGDDIIARARNSVDITSSEKDVRVKAKANIQVLAGNGGTGGVLIESKATGKTQTYKGKVGEDVESSGIILKAAHSQVSAMASEIYLRTGSAGGGVDSGKIVLDADKGNNNVEIVCREARRYIGGTAKDSFGSIDSPTAVNVYSAFSTSLGSALNVASTLAIASNGLRVRGPVSVTEGHISTEMSANYQGLIGDLAKVPAVLNRERQVFDKVTEDIKEEIKTTGKAYKTGIQAPFHEQGKIGNDETQRAITVTLRNEEQYGTQNYVIPEAAWQRIAEKSGSGRVWKEDVVTADQRELMPYPGKQKWADQDTLHRLNLKLHDTTTGKDKPLSDDNYREASYGDWDKKPPQTHYRITI